MFPDSKKKQTGGDYFGEIAASILGLTESKFDMEYFEFLKIKEQVVFHWKWPSSPINKFQQAEKSQQRNQENLPEEEVSRVDVNEEPDGEPSQTQYKNQLTDSSKPKIHYHSYIEEELSDIE